MVTCIQIIYSNDSKHKLIKKENFFYDDYGEDDGFFI